MLAGSKNIPQGTPVIKILILASEPDFLRIRDLLSKTAQMVFEVTSVGTVAEALPLLGSSVDVILMDVNLPDAQGLEGFRRLHPIVGGKLPIVLLSADNNYYESLEAMGQGAQEYLVKSTLNENMLPRVLRYAVERKRFHQHIYTAEEKYRSIFENSAVAITLADEHGNLVSWNRRTETLLEMGLEDLKGKNVSALYPAAEWKKIKALSIRSRGIQPSFETRIIKKNGDLLDIELAISILKDEDGKVTGSIGIMQDITERKRLESVKDDFLNTVSHEMRTPMTIIREGVSQVLDGILGPTSEEQKEMLQITLEAIDRLGRIIDDLLNISKIEAGKMKIKKETINLVDVAKEVEIFFKTRTNEKQLKIAVETDSPAIEVEGDFDRLIQVFTNLVGNAYKFTEHGTITLRVTDHPDYVEGSVTDTGKGISKQDLPKVFEKFQQFGREMGPGEKGTGLGLSICKEIIELHGGTVWVESELNKGSKFSFRIPKKTVKAELG